MMIEWLKNKIPIYHNTGYIPCGEIAFYSLIELISDITLIKGEFFEKLDGTNPNNGDDIICGNCERGMHGIYPEDLNICEQTRKNYRMENND